MLHLTDETSVVSSCEIEFSCPICTQTNVSDLFRFVTVSKLYGFVPVWWTYETSLKCIDCLATFKANRTPEELAEFPPEDIASNFRLRVGLLDKFLVIFGWLFFYIWLCLSGHVYRCLFQTATRGKGLATSGFGRDLGWDLGWDGRIWNLHSYAF